uniref:Zinc finger, CCHC-type n=1 Tax=Tanacetum cinerariifolium TaxID=118510 RepID=A0A6L2NAY0_TANCI|nr:hypothetical protein [Tanacetum cinerariifolium]
MAEDSSSKKFLDFKHTLKHGKDDLSLVQLGSHLYIKESLKAQNSDKGKGKEVGGPSINMTEEGGKNKHHKQNKGKKQSNENNSGSRSNKKPKLECWKYGKTGHLKKDCQSVVKRTTQMLVVRERGLRTNPKTKVDAIAWWIDSGATTHVCKDHCWFNTYEPVEDGFVLYMDDDHFAPVHGKGSVYESDKYILSKSGVFVGFGYYTNVMFMLNLNKDSDDSDSVYMSSSTVVNSSLWHARLEHVHYKRMLEMSKDYLIHAIDENPEKCTACMLKKITRKPFQSIKRKSVILELIHSDFCDFHATPSLGNKKPKDITPNSDKSQRDDHSDDVPNEIPEPRKEAIDDEIGSIMENNTWVLSDLPSGCKPLGFRQKEGIDYFDTYAPVARITTIILLLALAAIHNLVIHQMDVKTAFLNGDLDEEMYMKQPKGFVMLVDKTKKFLSSRFSMKDMGEADVILGIKIKRENKGIVITQSHYIEKILKKFNREDCSPKFNREDCSPVSTPMDPVEKLKPNTGKPVDQLEYSRAIGCLMYAMTSTRLDIAYVVGRFSRFTSNPSIQHWKAITRASKKQTCITGSTIESEFVALAAAGKEAEWLRNLIYEIPIWLKPITPISIRCDSAPTMARAYSQIYNGKSRHLGVRHSMVRELIRNGVISIEFVRTQHNLADHLTKGLARDLNVKSLIQCEKLIVRDWNTCIYLPEVQELKGPPM